MVAAGVPATAPAIRSNYPPPVPPSRRSRPAFSTDGAPPARPKSHRDAQRTRSQPLSVATDSNTLYALPLGLESPATKKEHRARPRPGGFAAAAHTGNGVSSRATSPAVSRRGSTDGTTQLESGRRRSDHSIPTLASIRVGARSPANVREGNAMFSRSNNLSEPSMEDLRLFGQHCRLFYFSQDPPSSSADYISNTLATLPSTHRAAYTRLQSSLRSMAHLHHLRVRITAFHALTASTSPSGSLNPHARSELGGPRARLERRERFTKFIDTWCTSHSGGVEPFFRGLYAVLRLQSRGDVSRGGASAKRVVWEIDDAVFMESGGPEFLHEAVQIVKGILGFSEQSLTTPPRLRRIRTLPRAYLHRARRQSGSRNPSRASSPRKQLFHGGDVGFEELLDTRHSEGIVDSPVQIVASPSDPFIDAAGEYLSASPVMPRRNSSPSTNHPLLPRQTGKEGSAYLTPDRGSNSTARVLQAAAERVASAENPNNRTRPHRSMSENSTSSLRPLIDTLQFDAETAVETEESDDLDEDDIAREEADLNQPRSRLWTFPAHITDDEAETLLAQFPKHIMKSRKGRRHDVRFPYVRDGQGAKDLESSAQTWESVTNGEGQVMRRPPEGSEALEGVVRSGTGRMWRGLESRNPGWEGGGWFRFKRWWKRLFGVA